MSKAIEKQLDELLVQANESFAGLEPLLAAYSDCAAQSNIALIQKYGQQIYTVCEYWEASNEEAKGIKLLCAMLTNFYTTHFHEVANMGAETISILSNTKYRDLYGIACMIYGANHRSLGNLDVAVEYLNKGAETIDINGGLSIYKCYSYYQLAEINNHIEDYESAEFNYNKAVEIAEHLKNLPGLFRTYNGIANFYLSMKDFDRCKKYLDLSLSVSGLTPSQQSRTTCDLGIYYYQVKDFEQSEHILQENYKVRKEANLEDASSTSLIALARTQLALKKFQGAEQNLNEALRITKKFDSKSKMLQCFKLMAELYVKTEQWEKAANAYQEYDTLQTEQAKKQLQNIYQIKNKQIQKQKDVIEDIYNEVQDSIRYAKRIQSAILPPDGLLKERLPNSFVLYKPKDIVAGDFYWLEVVGDKVLFAAADCTGHGVPGAMVSVVCNNGLNRSVREHGLTKPGDILDKTRAIVVGEFEKSREEVKDGMDIALCTLQGNVLEYAGAHNPLWIIRSGSDEIEEIKADKQPIGKTENPQPFNTHQLELGKGDTLYIFSDGYADQFGGERGKKMKTANFKKRVLEIQGNDMQTQKQLLEDGFESWKGDLDQLDDVCVIGVKL